VQWRGERGGGGDAIDNYTAAGAYLRPPPGLVQLEYRIDVFATARNQEASLLADVLGDFGANPFLVIDGEPAHLLPFRPANEEIAPWFVPGRTPLYYRLTVPLETGARRFQPLAVPVLRAAPLDAPQPAEVSAV
jgi:hypothetical protein